MLEDFLELTGPSTLLNFGNDFLDNLSESLVPDLEKSLKEANVNEKLAEFILATRKLGAYETKMMLLNVDLPFPSTYDAELEKLKTINDYVVKRFILDMTSFMQHAFNTYKDAFGTFMDWSTATCLKEQMSILINLHTIILERFHSYLYVIPTITLLLRQNILKLNLRNIQRIWQTCIILW